MKRTLVLVMAFLLALSLLTACSGNTGDNVPTNTGEDVEEINADDWFVSHWWGLRADFSQNVKYTDFDSVQGMYQDLYQGMYFDMSFKIKMEHDEAFENNPSIDGDYWLWMDSTISIDTDEAADRILSEKLGGDFSGMGLGISGELSGSYQSYYSYTDNDGNYRKPEFDEDGNYIAPDGQKDKNAYVQRVAKDWRSPIKDKNGGTVQPAAGSYMLFEAIKVEYTGSTSHVLAGSFGEKVIYDLYIYIVIEPDAPGADINVANLNERDAKVYIDLHTVNGNHIWIEGDGIFFLDQMFSPLNTD
ncbi:MAG: hypothetical protein FWG14_05395 [Peptococcaceae bacterium]|nr:hypothetical protein [Peptococcaceae bacterium]